LERAFGFLLGESGKTFSDRFYIALENLKSCSVCVII